MREQKIQSSPDQPLTTQQDGLVISFVVIIINVLIK